MSPCRSLHCAGSFVAHRGASANSLAAGFAVGLRTIPGLPLRAFRRSLWPNNILCHRWCGVKPSPTCGTGADAG